MDISSKNIYNSQWVYEKVLNIINKLLFSHYIVSNSLATPWTVLFWLLCPLDFLGSRNTGVEYHFLLQGIFQTQGLNLLLLHGRQTFYFFARWILYH